METPVQVVKHGKTVWHTPTMDGAIREEHCMCYHCGDMKPGSPDHCKIAAAFYEICKENGCAFILTRCGSFKKTWGE